MIKINKIALAGFFALFMGSCGQEIIQNCSEEIELDSKGNVRVRTYHACDNNDCPIRKHGFPSR